MMAMLVATFVLAIVGTVAGVGSLVWSIVTFKRSGAVVKVKAWGGYGLFVIEVANTGRAPVTVVYCGPAHRGKSGVVRYPGEIYGRSDELPFRLEQGDSGTWRFIQPRNWPKELRSMEWPPSHWFGIVDLADGRTFRSKSVGDRSLLQQPTRSFYSPNRSTPEHGQTPAHPPLNPWPEARP